MIREWKKHPAPAGLAVQAFIADGLVAFVAREEGRWHLSISALNGRYPTWDEIADARYDLLPGDLDFGIILPPLRDYLNLKGNVFHLWEIQDAALPIERGIAMPRTHESGLAV